MDGKVAIVTGAARGIGLAIAEALHLAGAQVWLAARSGEVLAAEAARLGAGATPHRCDLTDPRSCEALVERVVQEAGRLDVLVHSAGTIGLGTVQETSPDVLRGQLESNLVSAYSVTHAALPALVAAEGDVVFVGSSVSRLPGSAGKSPYAASHHGLRAFSESLREELNPRGVRVAFLHAGQTATARQEGLYAASGRTYRPERLLQPADVAAVALLALQLPRNAEITEVSLRPRAKP